MHSQLSARFLLALRGKMELNVPLDLRRSFSNYAFDVHKNGGCVHGRPSMITSYSLRRCLFTTECSRL